MLRIRKRARILLVAAFLTGPSSVLFSSSIGGQPVGSKDSVSKDITIKSYKGFMKEENRSGGFLIEDIFGPADLKAAGPVKIKRIEGDLKLTTRIGDIEIGEAKGQVAATAESGNININKAHKHVSLSAEMGEVIVQSAKSVDVKNILGGDVKLLGIEEYSTVATRGNILCVINTNTPPTNLCTLSSKEGDVTLYLPKRIGADIEIWVPLSKEPQREIHFESDFPFTKFDQRYQADLFLILSAQINGGGSKIHIDIERGNIYLRSTQASH